MVNVKICAVAVGVVVLVVFLLEAEVLSRVPLANGDEVALLRPELAGARGRTREQPDLLLVEHLPDADRDDDADDVEEDAEAHVLDDDEPERTENCRT